MKQSFIFYRNYIGFPGLNESHIPFSTRHSLFFSSQGLVVGTLQHA
ncbi:hypothetical protein EMIT036CA2_70181 [Chryseobacterium sp. IT-36CA2]